MAVQGFQFQKKKKKIIRKNFFFFIHFDTHSLALLNQMLFSLIFSHIKINKKKLLY